MNIRFLTIPLMALCLVACSGSGQDDPSIPDPPTPTPDLKSIGFGGNSGAWQEAPTSRATDSKGLETLFKSFRAWGYKTTNSTSQTVMDGYNVIYKENTTGNSEGSTAGNSDKSTEGSTAGGSASNTTTWEYVGINNTQLAITQTIKYWDYSASDYRFFAYAPADASITSSKITSTDGNPQLAFSIPYTYTENATDTTTPYVSDLWYSDNTNTENKYGSTVKLTFAPVIAKVRFKFSYPDNIKKITIHDIQFRDSRLVDNSETKTNPETKIFPKKGTITATYSLTGTPQANETTQSYPPTLAWTTSSDADAKGSLVLDTPYEEENDKIHIINDINKYHKWYYLPPLGLSTNDDDKPSTYTINATINGKHSSATIPADYMQWKAGYQYTYIFKITEAGDDITFDDLEVEIWKPGKDIDNNGSGTAGW